LSVSLNHFHYDLIEFLRKFCDFYLNHFNEILIYHPSKNHILELLGFLDKDLNFFFLYEERRFKLLHN